MADHQADPAGFVIPVAGATFGSIHGHNTVADTHVSGGTFNVSFFDGEHLATPPPPFALVPFPPDRDFIERPGITAWLTDRCQPGSRAALTGLGGVGKTQIAIQYAHQVRKQSPNTYILWVHASTRARFEEAYRTIADRLQLSGRHDPRTDVLRLVHDWLLSEENISWLMVVDNADELDLFYPGVSSQGTVMSPVQRPLASFLPQSSNGRILVTSRSRDVAERLTGTSWNVREIPPMDEKQAKELFKNKLLDHYNEKHGAGMVSALEYMPLAITQAAAFILRRAHRMSPNTYLAEFEMNDKRKASLLNRDMGDLRRDAGATNSVIKTWQITYEQIQQERQSAAELLSFISLFNPQGIPEWVLRSYQNRKREYQISNHTFDKSKDGNEIDEFYDGSLDDLDEDIEILRGYSLMALTAREGVYEIHALVQFCTRVWLSSLKELGRWKSMFLEVMSEEYPPGKYENWTKCQQLEPHIAHILEIEPSGIRNTKNLARLLTNAGSYRCAVGRYESSNMVLRKAVNLRKGIFGEDSPETLTSMDHLAELLFIQGKYPEAEEMLRLVVSNREKALGKDDPDTLHSSNNLARVLLNMGKYEEAVQISRQVFNSHERTLGEHHKDTLNSGMSLAIMSRGQGKLFEAEQIARQVLNSRRTTLGEDHPDTLTTLNNLAVILRDESKFQEAEMFIRHALDGRERTLGGTHPHTVMSVHNLAVILQCQGKCEEAMRLNQRALEAYQKVMGKTHFYTLGSLSNLAGILQRQGKYDEAEALNRQVLDGREKVFGRDHPKTLMSINFLATVLQDQGRYEEAETMHRRALDGFEKAVGKEHPLTIISVRNLVAVLLNRGKHEEAEEISHARLAGREKAL